MSEPRFSSPTRPCDGCAHSAAGAPFPGFPSGERPCCFCVRNPNGICPERLHPEPDYEGDSEYARKARATDPSDGLWYDGTPAFQTPMDCYIATNRSTQQQIFNELNRLETRCEEAPPREEFTAHDGSKVWCCGGGPGPGGHTWTCWRWLGIAYG